MNCPSRTDDDLDIPGWNQNPPRYAADLTTRQDMNGIANSRELGDKDRRLGGHKVLESEKFEEESAQRRATQLVNMNLAAKDVAKGSCAQRMKKHILLSEYQANLYRLNSKSKTTPYQGWAGWFFSVLCVSSLISYVNPKSILRALVSSRQLTAERTEVSFSLGATSRQVKRASCAVGGANPEYDVPLHVGALFIILFVSSTACAFPILVVKFPRLRIPASFLFSAKHFGTGVLIATAFVHLLPTAFISLGNPCLSDFWTTDYPAMPGAIALAGIFFVTVVEMVFSPTQHTCVGGHNGTAAISRRCPSIPNEETQVRELGPLYGRAASVSRTLSRMGEENRRLEEIETTEPDVSAQAIEPKNVSVIDDAERSLSGSGFGLSPEQAHKKAVMQCFLLEMGILFHSVFIGMSLSVSVGSEFVVLLIAIIFHQTFEGLALGVRIATINWPHSFSQPWLMAIAYGCTTPLGQAIGISVHSLYSPDSDVGLVVVGVMNAISAGLLVFASLVELMSEDFLSDESRQSLKGKRRVYACVLVFAGAFFMSLVGAWA